MGAMPNVPVRELHTRYGVLFASTADGQTVRFSTTHPAGAAPGTGLSINGVSYSLDVRLRHRDQPEVRRAHHWDLGDTWRVDADEALHCLRRLDGGESTARAWMTVRDELLLDRLARWLRDGEGKDLLEDGRAHRRAERELLALDAQTNLQLALHRVWALHDQLRDGSSLRPSDERFLQDVSSRVEECYEAAYGESLEDVAARIATTANPSEVPGL